MHKPATIRSEGFTLVELLVAMLVVVILMLTVVGILNSANSSTGESRRRIIADNEARTVFDRIADDLAHMNDRADVDLALGRNAGNDALFFFCEGPGLTNATYQTAHPDALQNVAALVGYRINASYQMERLGKSLAVGAAPPDGMVFLTYPAPVVSVTANPPATPTPDAESTFSSSKWKTLIGNSPAFTNGTDTTFYHPLSESVFRFEFCYLLKPVTQADGSVSKAGYSNFPSRSITANPVRPGTSLQQVQAIVVGLAVLDPESRKIVNPADLATLASAFKDPAESDLSPSTPKLMAQSWNTALVSNTYTGTAKLAAAHVRIYQRTFYLHPFLR